MQEVVNDPFGDDLNDPVVTPFDSNCFVALGGRAEGKENALNLSFYFDDRLIREFFFYKKRTTVLWQESLCFLGMWT